MNTLFKWKKTSQTTCALKGTRFAAELEGIMTARPPPAPQLKVFAN
jgi:hypothetical protein